MLIKTKRFEVELQGGGQFLRMGKREYWLERTDDRPDNKARGGAQDVVQYRLRALFSNGGPLELSPEKDRLSKLVNHLPQE